jgi:hypothetical protein
MIRSHQDPGHVALYISKHGQYRTDLASFDALMAEYADTPLPKLRADIQKLSDEHHGGNIDYSDLRTVTECLFILAELSGMATN